MPHMEKADLVAFCRADRDALLKEAGCRLGLAETPVPAEVIDMILEETLGLHIVEEALDDSILGHCDFRRRRVLINTRIPEITLPNTNVAGVVNSTKAHELGHVRLGHDRELMDEIDTMTLPLFDVAAPGELICRRNWTKGAPLSEAERIREYQADYYASVFLVPEPLLFKQEAAQVIEQAWRRGADIPSGELWPLVLKLAGFFHVSGALMASRLSELGRIVVLKNRDLAIRVQAWLPLMDFEPA